MALALAALAGAALLRGATVEASGRPPATRSPPRNSQPDRHGVQLRLALGPGMLWAREDAGGSKLRIRGGTASAHVALGTSLTAAFALQMEVLFARAPNASYDVDGARLYHSAPLSAAYFGLGGEYRPSPHWTLAASLGLSRVSISLGRTKVAGLDLPNLSEVSDVGAGLHLLVGRQLWRSRHWSLGANAQLLLLRAKHRFQDSDGRLTSLALVLLATLRFA